MRWFTKNLSWKLLALATAALLWVLLNRETELTTEASARVEFKNMPEGMEISAGAPERIVLRVHGPSGRITPSVLRDLAIILDCSNVARAGVYTFDVVNGHRSSLPADVAVDAAIPSQLHLSFERSISRVVRVVPRYFHPPPPGYEIVNYQIRPTQIAIRGPESHVEQIREIETDPIDLSGVVGEREMRVPAHIDDPQIRLEGRASLLTYRVVLHKAR